MFHPRPGSELCFEYDFWVPRNKQKSPFLSTWQQAETDSKKETRPTTKCQQNSTKGLLSTHPPPCFLEFPSTETKITMRKEQSLQQDTFGGFGCPSTHGCWTLTTRQQKAPLFFHIGKFYWTVKEKIVTRKSVNCINMMTPAGCRFGARATGLVDNRTDLASQIWKNGRTKWNLFSQTTLSHQSRFTSWATIVAHFLWLRLLLRMHAKFSVVRVKWWFCSLQTFKTAQEAFLTQTNIVSWATCINRKCAIVTSKLFPRSFCLQPWWGKETPHNFCFLMSA